MEVKFENCCTLTRDALLAMNRRNRNPIFVAAVFVLCAAYLVNGVRAAIAGYPSGLAAPLICAVVLGVFAYFLPNMQAAVEYRKNAVAFVRAVLKDNDVELGQITTPEVKRRIVDLPPPDAVIRAVTGTDIELPCLLAAWLTLSMSEIRGLTKSKSLRGDHLIVCETLVRVRGQDIRREGGKEEQRSRVLALPAHIRQLIDQVDGDIIVPMTPAHIEGRFNLILRDAGLPHMTFHQLRHLSASTMAMLGVSWFLPPKGMSTVAAPMVESKRSERPLLEATFMSVTRECIFCAKVLPSHSGFHSPWCSMRTIWCLGAPLLARNSREMSTMVSPSHTMRRRGSSVTRATTVASRFSSWA